ncbi:MAG: transposase [Phycisphaerales bacterium]|nr:transposase [Phycisphaerales bacterium]
MHPPHRKRMQRHEIPGGVRFITCSCQRHLPLLRNPAICLILLEAMARARAKFSLEIFAWVLMPEHIHLLLRPPEHGELAPALKSLKLSVSMRVIARWREIDAPILARIADGHGRPRHWQKGGGFDRNVRDDCEFRRPRDKQGAVYSSQPGGAGTGREAGGLAMVERALVDGASGRGVPVRPAPGRPRHVGGMGGVQMRVRLIRHRSTDLSKQRSDGTKACCQPGNDPGWCSWIPSRSNSCRRRPPVFVADQTPGVRMRGGPVGECPRNRRCGKVAELPRRAGLGGRVAVG